MDGGIGLGSSWSFMGKFHCVMSQILVSGRKCRCDMKSSRRQGGRSPQRNKGTANAAQGLEKVDVPHKLPSQSSKNHGSVRGHEEEPGIRTNVKMYVRPAACMCWFASTDCSQPVTWKERRALLLVRLRQQRALGPIT